MTLLGFSRIVVAVDGSEASLDAVDHASRLAKYEGAELTALHVVPKPPFDFSGDIAAYYDDAKRKAKKWLRDVESIAARHGIGLRIEVLVDASSIPEAILGYAESCRAELIVTGTRGTTPSRRMLMGSVAMGLVEYATCPVLVVR